MDEFDIVCKKCGKFAEFELDSGYRDDPQCVLTVSCPFCLAEEKIYD